MLEYIVTLSLLIAAVLLVRGIFRKTISPRVIYALWLVVVVRLCLPFSLFEVEVPLPTFMEAEDMEQETETEPVSAETTVSDKTPIIPGNVVQTQTPTYPVEPPVTSPVTPIIPSREETERREEITPITPQEPVTETPEEKIMINWKSWTERVWIAGSIVMAVWFTATGCQLHYRLYKDRRWIRTIHHTKVYVSQNTGVPCLAGLIPSIYITPEAEKSKSQTLIMIHEYTHMRHGDHIWAFIRILALIVHWWNPLVWAAAFVSKQDAELACDAAVAAKLDDETRLRYAHILLDTVPQKHRYTVGLSSAPMKERIIRLTKKQKNRWICMVLAIVLTLSAAGCSFVSLNGNVADDEEKDLNVEDANTSEITPSVYEGEYEFLMTDESESVSLFYGAEENDFAKYFRITFDEYEAYIAPSTGAWLRYTWEPMIYCMDIGIPGMPADGTNDAVVILTTGTGTGIHMKEAYVLSGADGILHTFAKPFETIENAIKHDENGNGWIVDSSGKRVNLPGNAYFDKHYKYYIENDRLFAEVNIGYGMLQHNGDCFKIEYSADGVTWKYHSKKMYDLKPSLTIPCDELLATMEQIENDETYPDEIYTINVTELSVPVKLYMRMDSVAAVEAHGQYIELREPRDIYGNCNFELFEAEGAIILEGGYYRIGDIYILLPEKTSEIHPGEDASYFLSIEDGRLRYHYTHNSIADITQTGALSVAVSYDEFLYSTGDALIVNSEVVFYEPDESYVMSDKYDLDKEFAQNWSDSYGSIEEKFAANRAARDKEKNNSQEYVPIIVASSLSDFKNENPGNTFVYEGYTVEYECESPYAGTFDFHIHLPQLNSDALYAEKWNYIYQQYDVEFGEQLRKTVLGTNTEYYAHITYDTVTTGDVLTIYIVKSHGILASGASTLDYDIYHYNTKEDRFLSTDEFIAYYAEGQFADYTVSDIVKFMNEHVYTNDEAGNPYPLTEENILGVIPSVFGDGKFDVVYRGYNLEGYHATRMLFSPYPTYGSKHQYTYRLTYHDYVDCEDKEMYGTPAGYRLLINQRVVGEYDTGYYVDCLFTEDIAERPESYPESVYGEYYTPVNQDAYGNMYMVIDHETDQGHLNAWIPYDVPETAQDYYRGVHYKYFSYDRTLNGSNYTVNQNITDMAASVLDAYRNGKDPNELLPDSLTEYTPYPLDNIRENPTQDEISDMLKITSADEDGTINFSIYLGDGWTMSLPIRIGGFGDSWQAYFTGIYFTYHETETDDNTESEESDPIVQMLGSVLTNQTPLTLAYSMEEMLLSEYSQKNEYTVDKYTILDLNDDREMEMVLSLGRYGNDYVGFLVLHHDKDTVYAHEFPYRGFNGLKQDGTFTSSSSAFNMYILKLDFDGAACTETRLAYREGDGSDASISYYIDDHSVTEEEFQSYFERYESISMPEWYAYDIGESELSVTSPIYLCDDVYRTDHTPVYGNTEIFLNMDSDYKVVDFQVLQCTDKCDPNEVFSRAYWGYAPAWKIEQYEEYDFQDGWAYNTRRYINEVPEDIREQMRAQGAPDSELYPREYLYLIFWEPDLYAFIWIEPKDPDGVKPESEEEIVNTAIMNMQVLTEVPLEQNGYLYIHFIDTFLAPYEEYMTGKEYLDLDENGIPELIVYNWGAGANWGIDIFTVENREIRSFSTEPEGITKYSDIPPVKLADPSTNAVSYTFNGVPTNHNTNKWIKFMKCTTDVKGYLLYSHNGNELWQNAEYYLFTSDDEGCLQAERLAVFTQEAIQSDPSKGWKYSVNGEEVSETEYTDRMQQYWSAFEAKYGVQYSEKTTNTMTEEIPTLEDVSPLTREQWLQSRFHSDFGFRTPKDPTSLSDTELAVYMEEAYFAAHEIMNLYYTSSSSMYGGQFWSSEWPIIMKDNRPYSRMYNPVFSTLSEWETYMRGILSDEQTDDLLATETFIDYNGELYGIMADAGTDISKKTVAYSVTSRSDTEIIYTAEVEIRLGEPSAEEPDEIKYYDFTYALTEDGWRWTDFYLYK